MPSSITCRENNRMENQISRGTEEGPPYMPWISRWKETPLVIGANVPAVCHVVLCGTHSTSLTQLSVMRLLSHSCCHLLSLLFLPSVHHALTPSYPFLTSSQLCISLYVTEDTSNEFLLLIRPVSALYSSVELQQMERAFIRFERSAATPKCHRGI